MNRLRRLIGLDEPQETRFFLLIAAWAGVLGGIYLVVGDDPAGGALLIGLLLASGAMAAYLVLARRSAVVRDEAVERPLVPEHHADTPGPGAGGVDRPFQDESGRLPDATLAPFAVGLGVALAATGPIFGIAPVAVGIVPFAWGCWAWFTAARAEHDAWTREAMTGDTPAGPPRPDPES
jgi:hypothetical protein